MKPQKQKQKETENGQQQQQQENEQQQQQQQQNQKSNKSRKNKEPTETKEKKKQEQKKRNAQFIADAEALVPGLKIVKDFISKEEEEMVINGIEECPWEHDLKRKVQQYGYKFNHRTHSITGRYLGPLPDFCNDITQRLINQGLFPYLPDQMIINHYAPGQGIFPHVDNTTWFDDVVGSVGLGSSCIMEFLHPETGQRLDVFFERRDAVILSGSARYDWKHGIPARAYDEWQGAQYRRKNRISLTWRRVILKNSAVNGLEQTTSNTTN